jgi:ribosomal protein S18 acetylase RimI-like enzyme
MTAMRNFDGSAADFTRINQLDELMCQELHEEGKPKLTAYGMGWFEAHCAPDRKSYRDWCTLTLEIKGVARGFCVFSRQTMAAPSAGRKRKRREAFMERFWISIESDLRGSGNGSRLLERSIEVARERWPEIVAVRLHVRSPSPLVLALPASVHGSDVISWTAMPQVMSNNAAVRFYKRLGFEITALKKDYPKGPCICSVLALLSVSCATIPRALPSTCSFQLAMGFHRILPWFP